MTTTLEADYLIVGAGAMGMAFADVLVSETQATVVLVDRHHQPGGHWNDAYPYVRLHQPSAFYGVNSRALGSDRIDVVGWNQGLYELATNSEVCAYFDAVMQQQFLPTDRVSYFPQCNYTGDGQFHSLVSQKRFRVNAKKIVDATYMDVAVPSMRAPSYAVAPGVSCVPPNALVKSAGQFDDFVVIGAGKTGMDACLMLLKHGVEPAHITWIVPRDSWLLDRANIQPGEQFADVINKGFANQMRVFAESETIDDVFAGCEAAGQLLRIDKFVKPTMYRCATVTTLELEQLQRVTGVVRKGRVTAVHPGKIELDGGEIETAPNSLHIDCSTDGLARRPVVPVFAGPAITLQSVRTCQQVFSAAFIAHVEAHYDAEEEKNALCTVVPHPDSDIDFLHTALANGLNGARWAQDAGLQEWLANSRLDGFTQSGDAADGVADEASAQKMLEIGERAIANLQRFTASA